MGKWVATSWSKQLSGRRERDTAPEIALRRALHRRGCRFRLHRTLARGCNPDLVLPKFRTAIWVDGCFWHGHQTHARLPTSGPNVALWEAKIAANRSRDERAVAIAEGLGWTAIRIWEGDIRRDVALVVDKLLGTDGAVDSVRRS